MMTVKIQIIIIILLIAFICFLLSLAKRKALDLKYILAWMLISLGVLVVTLVPDVMLTLSEWIGIFSPVNMVFFVGFLYLGLVVFLLSIAISRQSVRMKKMIQEIALLKRELENVQMNENNHGYKEK